MKSTKSSHSIWNAGIALTLSLLLILIFWALHCVEVNKFNYTQLSSEVRIADSETASTVATYDSEDATLVVYYRGGSTDSWVKETNVKDHGHQNLIGAIYNFDVYNNSMYKVSDWYIRQDITQDCYINNAWNGTIEFHQFSEDGTEKSQTLNLLDFTMRDITLDYVVMGSDLLIPLHEGDYIIYHPNYDTNEAPIEPKKETLTFSTCCGIIYYYYGSDLDLNNTTLYYKYAKSAVQSVVFPIFLLLLMLWAIAFFVCITALISSYKYKKQEKFIDEALTVFTRFVDAKDPYTSGHSNRVAEYSEKIAAEMGMSSTECKNVYYIALLHDVGKCYIDNQILMKPARLTPDEFDEIKKHTTLGAEMLKPLTSMPGIYDGALYHHERYDGKGYPTGTAGEDIPLIGRIICVADSFDAMNSDRCYRAKLPKNVIVSEIKNNAGTQFDPAIADIFLKLIEDGKITIDNTNNAEDSEDTFS